MKFSEAMEALQNGKKITRQQWVGSMYFLLDGKDVKSYQPRLVLYNYNEDIMITNGWEVEGQEGSFCFYDIIDFLVQGKKAKLSGWQEMYIQYDTSAKHLVLHSMEVFSYQPDFAAFMAADWVIIG